MIKMDYDGKLYFISEEIINNSILVPRIPKNYFTVHGYEDNKQKRVCFCKTIEKCLMALSKNCKDLEFNVYEVDENDKYQIFKPSITEVPDCDITGELWILKPVKLNFVGKIKCTGSVNNNGYVFSYSDKTARLYDWQYEWL